MLNSSINLSSLVITNPNNPLTREEIALNFCNQMNSYLLTILIFTLFVCCYYGDIKHHVQDLCNFLKKRIKNLTIKKFLIRFPEQLFYSLSFIAFTGSGIILYFYKEYLSIIQIVFISVLFLILAFNRLVDLSQWVINKVIERETNKAQDKINEMLGGIDLNQYIKNIQGEVIENETNKESIKENEKE